VVDGSTISRQHAILELRDDGLVVSDAGSRNGTRVNGSLVHDWQRVEHGDVIQLGHEQIVVELGDHEADAWETPLTSDFVELVAALRPNLVDAEGDSSGSIPTIEIGPPPLPTLPTQGGAEPELGPESDSAPDSHQRRQ